MAEATVIRIMARGWLGGGSRGGDGVATKAVGVLFWPRLVSFVDCAERRFFLVDQSDG